MKNLILLLLSLGSIIQSLTAQQVIFVKSGELGDGSSSTSAVANLKQAFDKSQSGDTIKVIGNIYVAEADIIEITAQKIILTGYTGSDTVFRGSDCEDDMFKLYEEAELIIHHLVLHGQEALISNADAFVKIYDQSRLELSDGAILCHNHGDESGTINVVEGSVWIYGGQILNNRAVLGAAAKIGTNGSLHFYTGRIAGNKANVYSLYTDYSAGAIELAGVMHMYGGQIDNNYSLLDGAAIVVHDGAQLNVHGGEISYNHAERYAGGISNYGEVFIYAGDIHHNWAKYSGAIDNNNLLTIYDGAIYRNVADSGAAGVYNYVGKAHVYGGEIYENHAQLTGGGWLNGTSDGGAQTVFYDSVKIHSNTVGPMRISSNVVVVNSTNPVNPNEISIGSELSPDAILRVKVPSIQDGAVVLTPALSYTITHTDLERIAVDQNGHVRLDNGNVVLDYPYEYTLYNQHDSIVVERAGIAISDTPFRSITSAMKAVEIDRGALSPDCLIHFGNQGDTLNVRDSVVLLSKGNYTLYGKLVGYNSDEVTALIDVPTDGVVNSYAYIHNKSQSYGGNTIYHRDNGEFNVREGSITSEQGVTILMGNTNPNVAATVMLNIYGGVINNQSDTMPAIRGHGKLNIYGGVLKNTGGVTVEYGTKKGGNLHMYGGYIYNEQGIALEIEHSQTGRADVLLAGGTIETQGGYAMSISTDLDASIRITGTHLVADTGVALLNVATNVLIEVSDSALITSHNNKSGTITLMTGPLWGTVLKVSGGTIRNTASGLQARAIYNDKEQANGFIEISGGLIEQNGSEGYGIEVGREFSQLIFSGPATIIGGTAALKIKRHYNNTSAIIFNNNIGSVDTNSIGISIAPTDSGTTMRYTGGIGPVVKHLVIDSGYRHLKMLMTKNNIDESFRVNDSIYMYHKSNVFMSDGQMVFLKATPGIGRKLQVYSDDVATTTTKEEATLGYLSQMNESRQVSMTYTNIPVSYTLSFKPNKGQGSMPDQTFYQDQTQKIFVSAFTRNEHRFIGWNTDSSGKGAAYHDQEEIKLTTHLTLYAQWEEILYQVVFINPSAPSQDTLYKTQVASGVTAVYAGPEPSKPSTISHRFTFKGWFTQAIDGNIDDLTPINAPRTVYAQFDSSICANTYTLVLDSCDRVTYKNVEYTSDATFVEMLVNAEGCDSTLTVSIRVRQSSSSNLTLTACESVTHKGHTYVRDTVFTEGFLNSVLCDSIQTVEITILKGSSHTLAFEACGSVVYDGHTYVRDTVFTETYVNSVGCDSIQTIEITILKASRVEIVMTGCDTVFYEGKAYVRDTFFTETHVNSVGCDSVYIVEITILKGSSHTLRLKGCESVTHKGHTYVRDTVFTEGFLNSVLCDSIQTVEITILKGSSHTLAFEACGSVVYDGHTYVRDTVFTETYVNSVGCDSNVLVTIRVKDTVLIRELYDSVGRVIYEQKPYFADTVLTQTFVSASGCDSTRVITIIVRDLRDADTDLYLMIAFDKQALAVANRGRRIKLQNCQFEWTHNGVPMLDTKQYVSLINRYEGEYRVTVKINESEIYTLDTILVPSTFVIYPNPAKPKEVVYVQGEAESTHIEVYNMQSQRILFKDQQKQLDRYRMDADLPKGVYIIRVMNGSQLLETLKLIIN